jgi:alpha-mannosidase
MSGGRGTRFSGISAQTLESVRVIEDGPVRMVVEALLEYGDSQLCLTYKIPKQGTEVEIHVRVYWNEKSRMLKLSVPTLLSDGTYMGQVAYGRDVLPNDGSEAVAHKWTGIVAEADDYAFTCINDGVYGSDCRDGELRISLLRSPGYSGHPIMDRPILPQDRFSCRMDQGERVFRFWFNGGRLTERLTNVEREALVHNEKPVALSFFPSGHGKQLEPLVTLDDDAVLLTVFKKAEQGDDYIIRLFEPTGCQRSVTLHIPSQGISRQITLGGFEIKTMKLNLPAKSLSEADLMES